MNPLDPTATLMKVKTKYLPLIFLALNASKSYGDETTFLKACRAEVYDRLVQEDKVITAMGVKLSKSVPRECLAKYEKLKRFIAIETADYFRKSTGDGKYRDSIDASLDEMPAQQALESIYSNLSIKGPDASYTSKQNASQIKVVKGYSVLRGSK